MGNCNKKDDRDFLDEIKNEDREREDSFAIVDEVMDDDGNKKYHIRAKN